MKNISQLLVIASLVRPIALGPSLSDALIVLCTCALHGVLTAIESRKVKQEVLEKLASLEASLEVVKRDASDAKSSVGALKLGNTRKF